jgi:2-polyprenyl-6-methoxyphenol hydroxylase-like FAD-dependent oxidoreductase
VTIVGGGPVGLTLALVLAQSDVPTLVLEARQGPTPRDESRAITWMPKGLEVLDRLQLRRSCSARGALCLMSLGSRQTLADAALHTYVAASVHAAASAACL